MTSELALASTTERADLDEQAGVLFSEHWPEYIFHDSRVKEYMPRKNIIRATIDFDPERYVEIAERKPKR